MLSACVRVRPRASVSIASTCCLLRRCQFHTSAVHFQSTADTLKAHSNIIGSNYVVRSPHPDIQVPTEDIYTLVTKDFPSYGPEIGLVDGISGREYSYNEIAETTSKFSSGLIQKLGFEKGDVLGIVAPNSPEYAIVYLGTLAAGGVVTTCNPTYTVDELAYQFKNSSTKIITTIPAILPTIQGAAEKSGVKKIIVLDDFDQSSSGNLVTYQSIITNSGSLSPVRTNPDDVMALPYSSGTTGLSKGVMLTNQSIGSNILQMVHPELLNFKEDNSKLIGVIPFFHIYGMVVGFLSSLYAGAKLVTLPKFEPETFLSTIEKYQIDVTEVAPPLILFFGQHSLVKKYNITSIKDMISGGAPLGADALITAHEKTGCKLIRQAYGLTETSPVTHMMSRSLGIQYPASVGPCIRSMKVKVVDPESGEALPPNKEGEVWLYGPNIMKGYLNNPEATSQCITEDGWFKSGDLGYYDDNGLFYITDRLKELIKVKGFQVAPAELEALLLTHPKIADVAVVGIPDERLGEAPRAFVVKKEEGLTEKEVQDFVAGKISKIKHLAGGVAFIDAVPKSASGKILRRMLR